MGSHCQKWGADPKPWCWVPPTCPAAQSLGGWQWHHCADATPAATTAAPAPSKHATDASRLAKLEHMLASLKKPKPKKVKKRLTKLQILQQKLHALQKHGRRRLQNVAVGAAGLPACFASGFAAALGLATLVARVSTS